MLANLAACPEQPLQLPLHLTHPSALLALCRPQALEWLRISYLYAVLDCYWVRGWTDS